jgi:hypothetical protein
MTLAAGRSVVLSRFRRRDDGSIAVLAAVTFPVVLLCVALALSTLVWASSEHEAQRAADTAAARAAATAFLGTDFPYEQVPGLTTPVTYPDVAAIAAWAGVPLPADASDCGTVGVPPDATHLGPLTVTVQGSLTLPADCDDVGPFVVPPPLGETDASRAVACATARDAMGPDSARYANSFYGGTGDAQPACALDGTGRIDVTLATGSPLVGFGQQAADAGSGALRTQLPPGFGSVAELLGAFGIHLSTALPSLLCPEVSVTVDQPVREPVFDHKAVPNGRATARRIVKNAVIVPVYNGDSISSTTSTAVQAGNAVQGTVEGGTTVVIPPRNLNSQLIDAQRQMLTLLDEVDAIADAAIRAGDVSIDQLNGTFSGIDPTDAQPPVLPGTGPLEGLRLTKCLRDTLGQIYDPPSGDAPTTDEMLKDAAQTGDQVVVVQVGAVKAACTEPGAIHTVRSLLRSDDCVRAATSPTYHPSTGLYEVPFFDVTPVLVQDVGNHNYEAVPVHASQAAGAFRGGLVRSATNERYDPELVRPAPSPACAATVPGPEPETACDVLSWSPSPLPTVSATTLVPTTAPPTTVPPAPSPSPSLSPLPTLSPSPSLSPLPTLSPKPTLPCVGPLCPHGAVP